MPYKTITVKRRRLNWTRAHMLALGNAAADAIKVRSFDRGLGVDERPYAETRPYSPRYEQHKLEKFAALNWLSYTGRLRQSIRPSRPTRTTVKIMAVGVPYAGKVNKDRPFMYSSPYVTKVIRATFVGLFKQANR